MVITRQLLTSMDPLVSKGAVCPYCGITYAPGDEIVRCPIDKAPHHAECWDLNGNCCTTLGCTGEGWVDDGGPISIDSPDFGGVYTFDGDEEEEDYDDESDYTSSYVSSFDLPSISIPPISPLISPTASGTSFDVNSVLNMSSLSSNPVVLSTSISDLGGSSLMSNMFGSSSLSNDYGALAIYTSSKYHVGYTVQVQRIDQAQKVVDTYYGNVVERTAADGKAVYVAIFPRVPLGNYKALYPGFTTASTDSKYCKWITVFPGSVSEVQFTI